MFAHGVIEHREIDDAVRLGDADAADEIADRFRRHAAAPETRKGRHARIVPAGDQVPAHQLGQHALGEHRVAEIEAREFVLTRVRGHREIVQEPFVERTVVLEFQGADRMGDVLDRVRLAVGEIVARIDAPGIAGARVRRVQDAVEHRIAQIDVARGHVDLGAEHARAVGEFARFHAAEEVEVLLDAALAERAVPAGLGQRAAARPHLLLRLVVDIGLADADQVLGPFVEPVEIIRRVIEMLAPVEAEPAHVALDGVDIFLLLLGRVGVVEAQIAAAAELFREAEIEADRFGVADMEIAVGLGREAGDHGLAAPGVEIGLDDVADEIAPRFSCRRFGLRHHSAAP